MNGGSRASRGPLGPFLLFFSSVSEPAFEILEHPADVGFRAHGATLANLFENAALALVSIAGEVDNVQPVHEYAFRVSAPDCESLLVAWLSEVLYWFDGKRIAFRRFRVDQIDAEHLTATGYGELRDAIRHQARLIVKAVTWHQLKVAPVNGGWMAEVYLDV